MDKKDIIEVLERIGTMMEIKGENPFLRLEHIRRVQEPCKPWRKTWGM